MIRGKGNRILFLSAYKRSTYTRKVVERTIFVQIKLVFWPKILFGFGIFEENMKGGDFLA